MRTNTTTAAGLLVLAAAATAAAGDLGYDPALDEKLDIPTFGLADDESVTFSFDLPENGNPVVGFSFSGTVSGISGTSTWASDTVLRIDAPGGGNVTAGGFNFPNDLDWDFDGSGSTDDGTYASGPHLVDRLGDPLFGGGTPKGGTWSFTFTQSFGVADQTVSWEGVSIVLHKIPTPGALALLGLAGLAGRGRRRA